MQKMQKKMLKYNNVKAHKSIKIEIKIKIGC